MEKRKVGRPRRYAPGKRPTLTFRIQEPLHEKLRAAAEAAGRSLSEEIERRVEQSFEADEAEADAAYSPLIDAFTREIAAKVTPEIETAIRKACLNNTAPTLDQLLLETPVKQSSS